MREMPETFMARLVRARPLTPRVRELTFEREDGKPFAFQAGQWVSLLTPLLDEKGRAVRRSYSIASIPGGTGRFELVVTKVEGGLASGWLHGLEPGASLEVKGPQGTFVRSLAAPKPSLLIATGTGIAPFRGMVAEALRAGRSEPLWILFGIRTVADGLYLGEFEALAVQHPCVRLELTLSRPEADWTGRRGYVQDHVRALWAELVTHGEPEAYVCGVLKMLTDVRAVLKGELGLDRHHIHAESYG